MKVGIVIPYYENSKEAKDRMEWLLDTITRNKSKIKVCVVDDGRSALWLDRYKGVKIIHNTHKGVSASRNTGLEYFKNYDYVGFLDADDSISDDYLKEAYKICKKNEYDIIDCRYIQSGIEVFGTREEREWQKNCVRNGVAGCFFKVKTINGARFDETMGNGEDTEFARRVIDLEKHKKGVFNGMYVYNYAVNPKSIIVRASRNEDIYE